MTNVLTDDATPSPPALVRSPWASAMVLLRLPFGIYLMPMFWLAVLCARCQAVEQPLRVAAIFAIIHLLLYPASNGFNSYYDKDEGPIGGLATPPPPPRLLRWLCDVLDVLAVLAACYISLHFAAWVVAYILFSRAYSHPAIRLKAQPLWGTLAVVLMQGAGTYLMVQAGLGIEPVILYEAPNLGMAAVASLLLLASYPLTQVYQHAEDAARGDQTLSRKLGVKGTFVFAGVFTALAMVVLLLLTFPNQGYRILPNLPFKEAVVIPLALSPVAFYQMWWLRKLRKHPVPTHADAMRFNKLASLLSSGVFIGLLAWWAYNKH